MNKKIKLPQRVRNVFVMLTFLLTYAFLSGNIIDIPHGTRQGGIISAVGMGIILIFMCTSIWVTHRFLYRRN